MPDATTPDAAANMEAEITADTITVQVLEDYRQLLYDSGVCVQ